MLVSVTYTWTDTGSAQKEHPNSCSTLVLSVFEEITVGECLKKFFFKRFMLYVDMHLTQKMIYLFTHLHSYRPDTHRAKPVRKLKLINLQNS